MKRLLLLLIATLAVPTAANAESVWLTLSHMKSGTYAGSSLEKVEMKDMAQRKEEEGMRWDAATEIHHNRGLGWHCVRGK